MEYQEKEQWLVSIECDIPLVKHYRSRMFIIDLELMELRHGLNGLKNLA